MEDFLTLVRTLKNLLVHNINVKTLLKNATLILKLDSGDPSEDFSENSFLLF